MRKYFGFPAVLAATLLIGCQADQTDPDPYSLDDTYNCFQDGGWALAAVDAAITGDWDWVYYSCYSGEKGEKEVGELMLKLKADHGLEVYRNGLLERLATWEVTPRGNENFTLKTSENIPWLLGDIVLCGNVLLFFNSYVNGCDNYFERI